MLAKSGIDNSEDRIVMSLTCDTMKRWGTVPISNRAIMLPVYFFSHRNRHNVFRGWLLRRKLYSPHTELGQRRLKLLWASFENDY